MSADWPTGIDFRRARRADLPEIVRLLADDTLGAKRERFETLLPESHLRAFEAIDRDPNQELIVATVDERVVGAAMIEHAVARAQERNCRLVQLTTDKTPTAARRFCEGFGFVASHEGMKLRLR